MKSPAKKFFFPPFSFAFVHFLPFVRAFSSCVCMLGEALLQFVPDFPVYFLENREENLFFFNNLIISMVNCEHYFRAQIAIKVTRISLLKWRIASLQVVCQQRIYVNYIFSCSSLTIFSLSIFHHESLGSVNFYGSYFGLASRDKTESFCTH